MVAKPPQSLIPSHAEALGLTAKMPPNMPRVSFGVDFGETHESVDFDYDAYAEVAKDVGLSEDAVSNVYVDILHRSDKSVRYLGQHMEETHTLRVKDRDPKRSQKSINETLAHESKHEADSVNGVDPGHNRNVIGNIGLKATGFTLPALIAGSGLTVASTFAEGAPAGWAATGIYAGIAAAHGALYYGYITHPSEVGARAAEKNARDVITLTKKQA
jgi:hypothetical protein